ncbi:MAG TPA: O-antigen ligase family protein [Candidatus Eisenbacteria bacterium]
MTLWPAVVLYALVALVPVVFYRGATEVFEFPKTELLATGALVLFASPLARELSRMRATGGRAWMRELPGRVASGARRDPLGAAIGFFLLSAVASTLASIRFDASLFGAHASEAGLKTAFATAAVYYTSRSLSGDPRHLDRLARAAAAALAVALFYALIQLAGLDPFPWIRSATLGGLRRVPGTLGHANHLGAFIAMALPLLGWLATQAPSRRFRFFWISLAAASLPVLAATLSRGAWVACAVGIAAYGLLAWRARPRTAKRGAARLVFAAVALALAAFLTPLFTQFRPELFLRLGQITDLSAPSTQSRIHLWRAGIRMAADRPVLGVGTDAYLAAFPRYRTPEYWRIEWNGLSAKAHNESIQVAATQGLLGLLAGLLVVFFATRAVLGLSRHRDVTIRAGAAAAGGALAAFAVQDLASFTVASTGILAAALAGWAAGVRMQAPKAVAASSNGMADASAPPTPGARQDRAAAAIAGGAVTVIWMLLVLLPWLADTTVAPGMRAPLVSAERVARLARASAFAPWDARIASELGRSLLARSFSETDSTRKGADLAQALTAFRRATLLSPTDGELRALLARTMAAQSAADPAAIPPAQVRPEFDRAIALEPENPNVLELVAQGYLEMGLTAEGRATALRCARLFPDFALPMADVGVAALLEGRPEAAADTLTLALRRNWHGEDGAAMAAKSNYVAALREMRLREALKQKR